MLRNLKNKGFASVLEVIITAIIFVVASAGILTTISMFRPQGKESSEKIEAAYVGKGLIEDLRRHVSAEDWNLPGTRLYPGTHPPIYSGQYTAVYTITEPSPDLRHMTVNVSW